MREILFRGKRIDDEKWIDGDLTRCVVVGETHIRRIEENLSTTTHRIDPKTVCQYTGLNDKSGRRYEGDIFQASDGDYIQRYIITWNGDLLEWSAECVGDPEGTLPLSEFSVSEIDVIGNIFDNPELIGEQI